MAGVYGIRERGRQPALGGVGIALEAQRPDGPPVRAVYLGNQRQQQHARRWYSYVSDLFGIGFDMIKFFTLPLGEMERLVEWVAVSAAGIGATWRVEPRWIRGRVRNFLLPLYGGNFGLLWTLAAFLVGFVLYITYKWLRRDRFDIEAERLMRVPRQHVFDTQISIYNQDGALVEGNQPNQEVVVEEDGQVAAADDNAAGGNGAIVVDPVGGGNPAGQPIQQRRHRVARQGVNIAIAELKMRFPYSRVRKVVLRGIDSAEADAERTCIKSELLMWMQQNNWRATDRRLYADEIVAAMFFPSALEIKAGALMTEALAVHARDFHDAILAGEDTRGAEFRAPTTNWFSRLLAQCGFRY